MKSLLIKLKTFSESIEYKYKVINYLNSKLSEIEIINSINNSELKEKWLYNLDYYIISSELEDTRYDIEKMTRHFVDYIKYNMSDCLFECPHPRIDDIYPIECWLYKSSFVIKGYNIFELKVMSHYLPGVFSDEEKSIKELSKKIYYFLTLRCKDY